MHPRPAGFFLAGASRVFHKPSPRPCWTSCSAAAAWVDSPTQHSLTRRDALMTHTPLRVLIVDDNRDGADSLQMILQACGHDARAVYEGESGLRLAGNFRPDVVLLDLGMPGLDGFEVARRLRQAGGPHHPLLVALTAWGDEEARRRTAETGFNAHLLKPADLGQLERLLAEAAARLVSGGAA